MTYQIAYGSETKTLEDPDQLVLITLPGECADMESDDLVAFINDNWTDNYQQSLVGVDDVIDSFLLAMYAEGIDYDTRERIITTVRDAIDNNA